MNAIKQVLFDNGPMLTFDQKWIKDGGYIFKLGIILYREIFP